MKLTIPPPSYRNLPLNPLRRLKRSQQAIPREGLQLNLVLPFTICSKLIIEKKQARQRRDLIDLSTRSSPEHPYPILVEYQAQKTKEADTATPAPLAPLLLPDLQLVVTFIINGKALDIQKQSSIKIECDYAAFIYNLGTFCNAKLPQRKTFNSEGITVVFSRAWVTANEMKAQRKKKQTFSHVSFDDESDFIALKHEVSNTKNPRECYLMIDAHITIDNPPLPITQDPVTAATSVQQSTQRKVLSSINSPNYRPLL